MENQQQIPPIPPIPPTPPTPPEPPISSVPPSQPIQPLQPRILTLPGVGNLLKRSWQIYKSRFWIFLGIMIIPAVISLVIRIFAAVFAISIAGLLLTFKDLNLWIIVPSLFVILLVILFLSFMFTIWPQVSLLYAIKEREQKIGIKESFAKGWHKIVSYWWLSLLSAFIVMGGLILFIVPGIIFAIWFSLALYILVAEDLKGMNALLRSKQLVRGYWGGVFWRFFIIIGIVIIISFGISFLTSFLRNTYVAGIISSIISLFLTAFLITYSFLIYEDLRKLKGEIPLEAPKKSTKIKFILVGILGLLLIPAILGSITLTSLSGAQGKARDANRIADLRSIQIAAYMYYDANNIYPSTLDDLKSYLYSAEIPKDPKTKLPYQYILLENGNDYEICADFEKDLQKKANNCLNSEGQWLPKRELKPSVGVEDETADWKTYQNEEYGFEVKYPKDWMYEQNVFSFKPNLIFCPLSLTEIHAGETICKLKTGASKPQYEDGMIYLFNYTSDPKPNNSDYRYLGVDYLGYYYYLYSSVSGNESIINQMLSTFRFLE